MSSLLFTFIPDHNNSFCYLFTFFRLLDVMMIPSEMPVLSQLSQTRAENGHVGHALSNSVSGLFGQLGPDQVQMLQSLQQIGQQKQKEVRNLEKSSWDTRYISTNTSLL